jgi:hypothetical protein
MSENPGSSSTIWLSHSRRLPGESSGPCLDRDSCLSDQRFLADGAYADIAGRIGVLLGVYAVEYNALLFGHRGHGGCRFRNSKRNSECYGIESGLKSFGLAIYSNPDWTGVRWPITK